MASKCKFQGPAGSEFTSFRDLASFSLNNCCPGWKDKSSFMIPPVFYYKDPEKSDHEIEAIEKADKSDRYVIDRTSDLAEQLMFHALITLINQGFMAPFVALHNFNVNRVSAHLGQIFPSLPSIVVNQKFGEYDYVLIGPRIGIVVIEVKSTPFTQLRDFNLNLLDRHKRLPEQYQHGIEQLGSFETVLDLLENITSTKANRQSVRRILFTPNLKRARYDEWFNSMDEGRRNNVSKCVDGIDRWFFEDISELRTKLRTNLKETTYPLDSSVFDNYVPILTGLASVTFTKTICNLDNKTLSEADAMLRISDSIETQNPWSLNPSPKKRKIDTSDQQKVELLKSIILTPEQSAALNGPPRQFIVGAAGTGKTIILQTKALELLRQDESVLVLCSEFYIDHYINLFEQHKLKGFTVKAVRDIRNSVKLDEITDDSNLKLLPGTDPISDVIRTLVRRHLMELTENRRVMKYCGINPLGYDHILIDDIFADSDILKVGKVSSIIKTNIMILLAYAELASHWKTAWVALDPFSDEGYFLSLHRTKHKSARRILSKTIPQFPASEFGASYLDRVMRNPENIFRPLLPMHNKNGSYQAPKMGHKIEGSRKLRTVASYDLLSKEIIDLLERAKDKYTLDQIAIIFGDGIWASRDVVESLEERNIPCELIGPSLGFFNPQSASAAKYYNKQSAVSAKSSGGKLALCDWEKVHSMEWPFVIYITVKRDHLPNSWRMDRNRIVYRNYLACSRATAKLVRIIVDNANIADLKGPPGLSSLFSGATCMVFGSF